jgi:hypothetical protein
MSRIIHLEVYQANRILEGCKTAQKYIELATEMTGGGSRTRDDERNLHSAIRILEQELNGVPQWVSQ